MKNIVKLFVVAAMAVDALGADRVHCVMLPYAYTSRDSLVDAEACAKAKIAFSERKP